MARYFTALLAAGVIVLALVVGCGDSATSSATNTGINTRDRDGAAATPTDQSNQNADVALTARIRQALVADQSLSTNAKNVKVIAANGEVTLRGPVNDQREREVVVRLAKQAAAPKTVVDNLDVAQP